MTTQEKLQMLYDRRDFLHPLSVLLVTQFVEVKKKQLRKKDEKYIEDVFSKYFPDFGGSDGTKRD